MISSSRFLWLLPLFRQFAYPFSETSNIWHMRTMGNSWRCSWINRNFTAGAARRCSPLFLIYPFLAAIFHFHASISYFPLLQLFDDPSLETLLFPVLQILCTIY